ncbi:MAG: DUF58 domain-containing protein [Candidatus Omnitrophota bacterium]
MLKLFSKRWIFLFIIIIFDFLIALRTAVDFFFFFFWFLVSVVAVSLGWLLIKYFIIELEFRRMIPAKVEEGDALDIETVIINKGFLPIFNFLLEDNLSCSSDSKKKEWILLEFLPANSSLRVEYRCECRNRGMYSVGPFSVYLFDPLGLFFLKKSYPVSSELYVYPQTFPINKFPALRKGTAPWFGIETSRVSGEEHEFYGIREYKPGDPIKRIHWFSTARANTLIVKEFQRQVFFRATIAFNLNSDEDAGEGRDSISEYTVKIAASVAKYLVEEGISVEIIAHAGELVHIPFNKGPEHLDDIFKFLAAVRPESKVKIDDIFEEFSQRITGDSNLVVIIPDKEWERLLMMPYLRARNVFIIPLVLVSSSFQKGYNLKAQNNGQNGLVKITDLSPTFFTCGAGLEDSFSG